MGSNVVMINGIPFGYGETDFEMPGDYLAGDEIPDSPLPDMSNFPADVRSALMALEAKETVLQYMRLNPGNWTQDIARLTGEIGSLRSGISFEYLSAYDNRISEMGGKEKALMFKK